MPGYDFSNKHPFRLMQSRLGVYDRHSSTDSLSLDGVTRQSTRLIQHGGNTQQERMIKDRRRTLDRATQFSYQAARVVKENAADQKPVPALVNPNKVKQDYDEKILSVGFEYNIGNGDIIKWIGTDSHWLVYLQDLTELAYFRGNMRRCTYQISWENEAGKHTTYAAVRGPVETKINYIQKHGISVDKPNFSLVLLMPNNEITKEHFQRYSKFYLQDDKTCWRVEGLDWLSTPGILEVAAVEYYANETEDDIENGIVGGLIVEPENPNTQEEELTILGDTFIKVKKFYDYKFNGNLAETWRVDSYAPVIIELDEQDPRKVSVKWDSTFSGQFDLYYGDKYKKTIVVESLF